MAPRPALVSVLVALAVPSSASAATRYVDDDGAQCPGAKFTTIMPAVQAANAGDDVRVCAGEYREQVIAHHRIRLLAVGVVRLHSAKWGQTAVSLRRGAVMQGFHIIGGAGLNRPGIGVALRDATLRSSGVFHFEDGVHVGTGGTGGTVYGNSIDAQRTSVLVAGPALVDRNAIGANHTGVRIAGDGALIQRNLVEGWRRGIVVEEGAAGNLIRWNDVIDGGCWAPDPDPDNRWVDNAGANCEYPIPER